MIKCDSFVVSYSKKGYGDDFEPTIIHIPVWCCLQIGCARFKYIIIRKNLNFKI